jgi:hypothetical protein
MSSYKLTPAIKESLNREAKRLVNLRVDAVQQYPFPLTREQVIDVTTPKELRECFRVLEKFGSEGMGKTATLCMIVPAGTVGAHGAVTTWPVMLEVTLVPSVYYAWAMQTQGYRSGIVFDGYLRGKPVIQLPFDTATLDRATLDNVVTWVNRAARERRIANTTIKLVGEFIEEYCNSTGELYRRWSGLRVLFDKLPAPWPERMRDVKGLRAGPSRWGWPGHGLAQEWYTENYRRMQGVEGVLVGAQTFDTTHAPDAVKLAVSARILHVPPAN